jgi:hypothetical protein
MLINKTACFGQDDGKLFSLYVTIRYVSITLFMNGPSKSDCTDHSLLLQVVLAVNYLG